VHGDQATPLGGTHDHPTQAWPEVTAEHTRLDLGTMSAGGALAEPTTALPAVPVQRAAPPPAVKAIPPYAPRTPYRPGASVVSSQPAIVGDLEAAPSAPAWRPRGGPRMRGIFGWVPTAPPSLREAAEARVRIAEREQQRKLRHARHLDTLEVARAYLGVTVLVALLVLVGAMAFVAFGILSGWYTWSPVHR